jgi:hypothetical protein
MALIIDNAFGKEYQDEDAAANEDDEFERRLT